jgi:hypothetical protein
MADAKTDEWSELSIVDKSVKAVRAGFAKAEFTLSAKPPKEWSELFGKAVDDNPETENLSRNPGPSIDNVTITWEINEDEIKEGWAILKAALEEANDAFSRAEAARKYKEQQAQERLDARDRRRDELDKQLKSLK